MPDECAVVWNVGCSVETPPGIVAARTALIAPLVQQSGASLIALQEAKLHVHIPGFIVERGSPKGRLATAFSSGVWQLVGREELATRGLGLCLLHLRTQREVFVWNLHLDSGLNGNDVGSRNQWVRQRLKPRVEAVRKAGRPELIMGDFNLDPYTEALMQSGGMWANRSLDVVQHFARKAVAPNLPLFNASWQLLGGSGAPPGTHYRTQALSGDGPWHVIDQILMSPDLAGHHRDHVKVIDRVGTVDLCGPAPLRRPNKHVGSDHLPCEVKFTL